MMHGPIYTFLYWVVRFGLFLYHPIFKVVGRKGVPKTGRVLFCCNHSGLADPVWLVMALYKDHMPRIMAKKEAMAVPVLGWFLRTIGVFGIDRDGVDISGIKTGIKCLRDEQQLLIFPEGTRVKAGERRPGKRGAVVLAQRTDTPIVPIYLTQKRRPFSKLTCVFGEPYKVEFSSRRPTEAELEAATQDLMDRIYALEAGA